MPSPETRKERRGTAPLPGDGTPAFSLDVGPILPGPPGPGLGLPPGGKRTAARFPARHLTAV